jgi:hypothetical protein
MPRRLDRSYSRSRDCTDQLIVEFPTSFEVNFTFTQQHAAEMPKRESSTALEDTPKRQRTNAMGPPAPKAPKDQLYDRCINAKPIGSDFTEDELLAFGIAATQEELGALCNQLTSHHLLQLYNFKGGSVAYRTRSKETALR